MEYDFWQQQEPDKPLFPDIEWSKPEQKSARGKLLIVGGSAHGFAGVGNAYKVATEAGAGEIKVALPDVLEKKLPPGIDGIFLPTSSGGGIGQKGFDDLSAAVDWADGVLLIGDCGQNSETATVFEKLLEGCHPGLDPGSNINNASKTRDQSDWILKQVQDDKGGGLELATGTNKWLTITRDAVDLLRGMGENLANRPNVNLVISFAQVQKLFSSVYYPKILTFSMQLSNIIDALHKFTTTYPITLTVQHNDQLIVAKNGEVISQKASNPMDLINGTTAARAATYLLWNKIKSLEAIATSWQK